MSDEVPGGRSQVTPPVLQEPPANPAGGRTLIVDGLDGTAYPRPSAALKAAGADDQILIRPGIYEDKIFQVERPIRLLGAGRDLVQIFSRRGGPFYLQRVPSGHVSGITFRYVESDQHSAINVLESSCTIAHCRAMEGILSGVLIYGSQSRPSFVENEVCRNRESGIFAFAGARPYLAQNLCFDTHHFGIAARDLDTRPDLVRNECRDNMLSGMLLFQHAEAMILENDCHDNQQWGLVTTPECRTTPDRADLLQANRLDRNPRGPIHVTDNPLIEIGR